MESNYIHTTARNYVSTGFPQNSTLGSQHSNQMGLSIQPSTVTQHKRTHDQLIDLTAQDSGEQPHKKTKHLQERTISDEKIIVISDSDEDSSDSDLDEDLSNFAQALERELIEKELEKESSELSDSDEDSSDSDLDEDLSNFAQALERELIEKELEKESSELSDKIDDSLFELPEPGARDWKDRLEICDALLGLEDSGVQQHVARELLSIIKPEKGRLPAADIRIQAIMRLSKIQGYKDLAKAELRKIGASYCHSTIKKGPEASALLRGEFRDLNDFEMREALWMGCISMSKNPAWLRGQLLDRLTKPKLGREDQLFAAKMAFELCNDNNPNLIWYWDALRFLVNMEEMHEQVHAWLKTKSFPWDPCLINPIMAECNAVHGRIIQKAVTVGGSCLLVCRGRAKVKDPTPDESKAQTVIRKVNEKLSFDIIKMVATKMLPNCNQSALSKQDAMRSLI